MLCLRFGVLLSIACTALLGCSALDSAQRQCMYGPGLPLHPGVVVSGGVAIPQAWAVMGSSMGLPADSELLFLHALHRPDGRVRLVALEYLGEVTVSSMSASRHLSVRCTTVRPGWLWRPPRLLHRSTATLSLPTAADWPQLTPVPRDDHPGRFELILTDGTAIIGQLQMDDHLCLRVAAPPPQCAP